MKKIPEPQIMPCYLCGCPAEHLFPGFPAHWMCDECREAATHRKERQKAAEEWKNHHIPDGYSGYGGQTIWIPIPKVEK